MFERVCGMSRMIVAASMPAMFLLALGAGSAHAKDRQPIDRVVLLSSGGMRPDLMEVYANAGAMPIYASLMSVGATGKHGMVQAFPPNDASVRSRWRPAPIHPGTA